PAATTRRSKRAASPGAGIASQATAGLAGPPVSATATAIAAADSIQAVAMTNSGRFALGTSGAVTAKAVIASARAIRVHQPSHGATINRATASSAGATDREPLR